MFILLVLIWEQLACKNYTKIKEGKVIRVCNIMETTGICRAMPNR